MTGSEPDCMCITQGKDKDPDSNTNAIEMQKCGNKAYAKKQEWMMNTAGQFSCECFVSSVHLPSAYMTVD